MKNKRFEFLFLKMIHLTIVGSWLRRGSSRMTRGPAQLSRIKIECSCKDTKMRLDREGEEGDEEAKEEAEEED